MQSTNFDSTPRVLLPIKDFSQKHKGFPEGTLRHLIFHREERKNSKGEVIPGNGMTEAKVIVRVGRKILIDETRFFEWLDAWQ